MGKTTKALLFCGALLVLLVGARVMMSVVNPPDDKALIQAALKDSIQASKDGKPGGVFEKLSANIKYNGEEEGGNRGAIADYIKKSKPDITVENMDPQISGDEATISSPVDLSVSLLGQTMDKHIKEVHLLFRKENDHNWLFLPTRKWKLAEVQVPDASVGDLFHQ